MVMAQQNIWEKQWRHFIKVKIEYAWSCDWNVAEKGLILNLAIVRGI